VMRSGARARMLEDGRRLHLQHGPIDLIIEAFGAPGEVVQAYRQAEQHFAHVLEDLVAELDAIRKPVREPFFPRFKGPVARRMAEAVWPHRHVFITPMAAVAGAVADEVLDAMRRGRVLERAYVNNGGDIALHLTAGTKFEAGIVADQDAPALDAVATVTADQPIRGIATSGWRGRSFSLGIADAATILAKDAATADAAATVVGNAVNVEHPAISRTPANSIDDDTDLGDMLTVTSVGPLPPSAIETALDNGAREAQRLIDAKLIHGAFLALQGHMRSVGVPAVAARQLAATS
jgi:ApbE superfamily uncharacterized protein (UPF0280 family)